MAEGVHLGFLCVRHSCWMQTSQDCAEYRQVRPWRCRGCSQDGRARRPAQRDYRITWTASAVDQKHRRVGRTKKMDIGELNEIFGVT